VGQCSGMTPEESRLAAVRRALKYAGLFGGLFAVSLLVFYFPLRGEPTSQGWLVSLIGSVAIAALGVGPLPNERMLGCASVLTPEQAGVRACGSGHRSQHAVVRIFLNRVRKFDSCRGHPSAQDRRCSESITSRNG
jgi:hypothetical protein